MANLSLSLLLHGTFAYYSKHISLEGYFIKHSIPVSHLGVWLKLSALNIIIKAAFMIASNGRANLLLHISQFACGRGSLIHYPNTITHSALRPLNMGGVLWKVMVTVEEAGLK